MQPTQTNVPVPVVLPVLVVQWLLMVASVNIEWPDVFVAPLSAVAWLFASSGTSTGLDCLLAARDGPVPVALQKVLLSLLTPTALLVILWCIDAGMIRLRKRNGGLLPTMSTESGNGAHGVFARTLIVLMFFFLPTLLRTAYGMFACVYLDSAPSVELQSRETFYQFDAVGRFWQLDIDQQCLEGYHKGWALGLGIPLLLLLCGAVPFGMLSFLWVRRERLQEVYYLQHFGFLYSSYRPATYFWEGVVALQVGSTGTPEYWSPYRHLMTLSPQLLDEGPLLTDLGQQVLGCGCNCQAVLLAFLTFSCHWVA